MSEWRGMDREHLMSERLIFIIDGGGSKTEAELRRRDGTVVGRHRAGPCNLYHDPEAGISTIAACWKACAGQHDIDPASAVISAGLAGTGSPSGRAKFYAEHARFDRALLSSDGYAALVGAFGPAPGALLAIGTGTVGCRFDRQGQFTQIGGWGFPAGDRGGGAWLGREYVSAWLEHRDAQGKASPLWDFIQNELGDARPSILSWLRAATPAAFAALVPGLQRAALLRDPVALGLLSKAGRHLARLATATLAGSDLPLRLSGGLAPTMAAYLSEALPDHPIELTDLGDSALEGAWRIALGDRPAEFAACARGDVAE